MCCREKWPTIYKSFMVHQAENRQRNSEGPGLSPRMQSKKIRPWRHQALQHPARQRLSTLHIRFWPQPSNQHHRQQPLHRWIHGWSSSLHELITEWENQQLQSPRGSSPWLQNHPEMGCVFVWSCPAWNTNWEVTRVISHHINFHGSPWLGKVG